MPPFNRSFAPVKRLLLVSALGAGLAWLATPSRAACMFGHGCEGASLPRFVHTPREREHAGSRRFRATRHGSGALAGVSAPLAAKAREIAQACGSRVVSGLRHTRVAGTGRWSLHASGRAVDMAGNPSCIYAHLRGWPGGYSIDYAAARHVHISLGGSEDGLRFAHRSARSRFAARRHRSFARVS